MKNEELMKLYDEVYDDKVGTFRLCGRDKCFELIEACKEYSQKVGSPITDFGDKHGRVNIENIKKLIHGS